MFSQMFLFIGVISATKENIVKHICFHYEMGDHYTFETVLWHYIKQSPCKKGVSCQIFSP